MAYKQYREKLGIAHGHLAGADAGGWAESQSLGEAKLRALAATQGLNWDSMSDEARQDFVEGLADEARS
jgi:hypothetical protein